MRCPVCKKTESKVLESRASKDSENIRRRRQCLNCKARFTTHERAEVALFQIKKRDGRVEPYIREKAIQSISIAGRKRPVYGEVIEQVMSEIEHKIFELNLKTVASSQLGDMILAKLIDIDPVAYVRFASVYRDFKSVEEFLIELQNLSASNNERANLTALSKEISIQDELTN